MQIGIDSFAAAISDPATGLTLSPVERMHHLLEEIELADMVGLDVFGIGEHHRAEFLDSAPDNPRLARRVGSVLAIFFGATFGAVVIRYSISAALALATAISVACSAALFRSLRTPDKLGTASVFLRAGSRT